VIQHLVEHYGYLAVFAGALLEGETVLVMGGFAAHRGLLALPWVLVLAAVGGFLGDQFFFFMGRRHGRALLSRFPSLEQSSTRVQCLLTRYDAAAIFSVRFIYGLRIAGPVLIGMSGVRPWRFVCFNLLGATVWASAIGGAGYLFGTALEVFLSDLRRYEALILILIAVCGGALWLWTLLRQRRLR
jgi:membrane protein DedA with SNARE-associated domain